ncbi:MAG: glyceraldehyde 3-phosphate dehydrogenase NAD-binding domain-containing protein [bacterium]
MAVRIGIMGFGRLGRNMFRIAHDNPDVEFVAVSDIADAESLRYLLQYSTIEGQFHDEVRLDGAYLISGRQRTRVMKCGHPRDVPWDILGADIVIEATGQFRRRDDLECHLDSGAKAVVLSTPPLDRIDRMIVNGVNDDELSPDDRIISGGSSSCHALALMLKILHEKVGVRRAVMTTVHAYTSDQQLSDAAKPGLRWSRSAAQNIIPNNRWAPQAVEEIMPALRGKISGMALNVPVPAGSNIDLVTELEKPLSAVEVNAIVKEAAEGDYQGLVQYTDEPIVSSDVVGNGHSAIFDAKATLSLGNGMVKTVSWYDNGWGYAYRILELAMMLSKQLETQEVAT